MRYQIAVCDDNETDIKYITSLVNQWAEESGCLVKLDSFSSAESFLFSYEEKKDYDILLLDIEMGKKSGIELARQVREENKQVQIVFVTGFPDFAMEGYEVAALHYLMKPLDKEKLSKVLDRAIGQLGRTERTLLLPVDGGLQRIPAEEIFMVEAFAHSVVITTGKDRILVHMPISELERQLGEDFVRCHRSYIAGIAHIKRILRNGVELDNGITVPLSRGNCRSVNQAFIRYYTEE